MTATPSMFDSPRPTAAAEPLPGYVQPNLGHGLRIWWAFYWRTVLGAIVLIVVVNIMVLRRLTDGPTIRLVAKLDPYVFYYFAAFFAMGYVLRKRFRHFHIVLLSGQGSDESEPLPPSLHRTARIWCTFTWRSVIYKVIASIAVSFPLGWIMGFLAALIPGRATALLISFGVQILVDAVVGMFVIYSAVLDEDISDFRVALFPSAGSESSVATVPASPS